MISQHNASLFPNKTHFASCIMKKLYPTGESYPTPPNPYRGEMASVPSCALVPAKILYRAQVLF